ncbi:MAG: hypothetical protein BM562_04500 [Alphaproteobacteria bacterium MedPE-SWcel]|nr:MAG: hypothetical protein BM562_04500 [Alphaproteobacteria bacterium MedPE-SWcel]
MTTSSITRRSTRAFRGGTALALTLSTALASVFASAAQAADLDAAQAMVDEYSALPVFEAPGKPFDAAACMAGKKVLVVPVTSAIPFISAIAEEMDSVADEVGFDVEIWKNQGQPTQWVQGIEYAIANGFDAVDLMGGIIPAALAPQLAAAHEAGLRVFATHHTDVSYEPDPNADVRLPLSFSKVGEILAAWVTTQTEGNANVLVIGTDDVPPSQPYWKSFEAKLAELSPESKATYVNVPLADWATKIQTSVQSNLLQDPGINYIVPIYDSMSQFVMPALAITGKTGQIPIATFNGTPFVLDMIREGDDVVMDIGESMGWIARSAVDAHMRDLCDIGDTPEELYVPLYIFTDANIESAGDPADFNMGYGDSFISGYKELWGL